jgi:hypothetical protein
MSRAGGPGRPSVSWPCHEIARPHPAMSSMVDVIAQVRCGHSDGLTEPAEECQNPALCCLVTFDLAGPAAHLCVGYEFFFAPSRARSFDAYSLVVRNFGQETISSHSQGPSAGNRRLWPSSSSVLRKLFCSQRLFVEAPVHEGYGCGPAMRCPEASASYVLTADFGVGDPAVDHGHGLLCPRIVMMVWSGHPLLRAGCPACGEVCAARVAMASRHPWLNYRASKLQ